VKIRVREGDPKLNRRKLGIIRALCHQLISIPKFVVHDERSKKEGRRGEKGEEDVPIHVDEILELVRSEVLHHGLAGDSADLARVHLFQVAHELVAFLGVGHFEHVLPAGGREGGREGRSG